LLIYQLFITSLQAYKVSLYGCTQLPDSPLRDYDIHKKQIQTIQVIEQGFLKIFAV